MFRIPGFIKRSFRFGLYGVSVPFFATDVYFACDKRPYEAASDIYYNCHPTGEFTRFADNCSAYLEIKMTPMALI